MQVCADSLVRFTRLRYLHLDTEDCEERMDNKKIASVLNNLISICEDGVEGYKLAAKEAKGANLKAMLNQYVSQRQSFASELQSAVAGLGVSPKDSGSAVGALHRTWMSAKSEVTGRDDAAILAECETGEKAAVAAYEDALKHDDLPANIRSIIQRQYGQVMTGRRDMEALHDQRA